MKITIQGQEFDLSYGELVLLRGQIDVAIHIANYEAEVNYYNLKAQVEAKAYLDRVKCRESIFFHLPEINLPDAPPIPPIDFDIRYPWDE